MCSVSSLSSSMSLCYAIYKVYKIVYMNLNFYLISPSRLGSVLQLSIAGALYFLFQEINRNVGICSHQSFFSTMSPAETVINMTAFRY